MPHIVSLWSGPRHLYFAPTHIVHCRCHASLHQSFEFSSFFGRVSSPSTCFFFLSQEQSPNASPPADDAQSTPVSPTKSKFLPAMNINGQEKSLGFLSQFKSRTFCPPQNRCLLSCNASLAIIPDKVTPIVALYE